ncbi:DUF4367 domain-containing protein [Alkalibaculum sporogenes]|nr:DUF4367 domain-containing protein [Alkalibaculum sporogenes]
MIKPNNDNEDKLQNIMATYYSYIGQSHVDVINIDLESKEEEINSVQIPTSLDSWFDDYIKVSKEKDKHIKRKKQIKQIGSKVAMIVLVISISLTILTFSVEAIRVKVLNLFIEINDKYSEFKVAEIDEYDNDVVQRAGDYEPMYIPEGFVIDHTEEFNDIKTIEFTDGDNGFIVFERAPNGTDYQFDTEDAKVSEILVKGTKGILIEKNNGNILFWNDEEWSYFILSDIELKIIIQMAESVEKK